jgi:hypothetical protein
MTKRGPRRSSALRVHLEDHDRAPIARYARVQRDRGRMVAIGDVDVDLEQLVERPFLCDRHRCIQWSPGAARALIDNSCCSRYEVPVTDLDRRKLAEILPAVRKRLPAAHPLRVDDAAPPYELDDEYAFVMREQPPGVCQFVLYQGGKTSCAIHKTCLEEGLDVWAYKPLGCSLWPLALVEWEDAGRDRMMLTVYGRATAGLFESNGDEGDDEQHFACLVDQDEAYEPMYRSMEGVLRYALGDAFWGKLDAVARRHLGRRA